MWVEIFDITDSCWIILKKIACYCFSIAFSAQKWLFWHILARYLSNSRSTLKIEEIIFQISTKSLKNGGKMYILKSERTDGRTDGRTTDKRGQVLEIFAHMKIYQWWKVTQSQHNP